MLSLTRNSRFQYDNRLFRIWYLRRLYFQILKQDLAKIGFRNAVANQFPLIFADAEVPPALSVELTNLCNLKCTYCTSPIKERAAGYMKQQTFERLVQDVEMFEIPLVRLVGNGEPTIHPDFGEYIKALKAVTPVVQLTTNANFIRPAIVQEIIDAGVNQVNVSVDGSVKEAYEKYRRQASFEQLLENLVALKRYRDQRKSKAFINIRVMVCPDEFEHLHQISSFWKPYADVVSKQFVVNIHKDIPTKTFETTAEQGRYPRCSLPFKILDVQWNGNIPLCSYSFRQTGLPQGVVLGNINTESLLQIWNKPLLRQYRLAHRKRMIDKMPVCNGCIGT